MKNIFILAFLFVITGCSTLKPESFAGTVPALDPVKFFGGHTHSSGVLEARSGKPSQRITTKTAGVYTNGILTIDQDLYPENDKPTHRQFKLKLIDAHHVDGTGNFIGDIAHGELYGNYFRWSFRFKIGNSGLVKHVNMTQYMYLMPGSKTLIIRSIVRKFGIIVKQITEEFQKDD